MKYACPMHPDVTGDAPGACRTCGMAMVAAGPPATSSAVDPVCGMIVAPGPRAIRAQHAGKEYLFCSTGCKERFLADPAAILSREGPPMGMANSALVAPPKPLARAPEAASYAPLIVVLLLIAGATGVLAWRDLAAGAWSPQGTVAHFMAGFFLVFAGFKLLDLPGFAHGYATYDLLATRVPAYGFVYPFIELAFGLAMLAGIHPAPLLWAEFGVMAFSGVGVALKLAKREPFQCACLGTFLKVPLTKVTLVEDFGMAALALFLLLRP